MKKIKRYLQQQGWYLESKYLYDGKATLLGGNLLEGKMNLKKTVVFLIVCITFFSCDKFLEESPRDKLPEDEVYNNISDVYLNAVASLYTYIGGYSDSQGLQGTGRGVYDLNTFTTVVEDEEAEIGGFARANTLIKAQRAKDPDTLVIDGGDFSMGTLIQTVFETQAAELRMLGYMGCDVTTFGNHEFDYRSKGLANMLTSARTSGDAVPAIVVCNVDWDAMETAGLTEGQQELRDAFASYGVQDYTVVQKGDVRIAVVGVFGKDALSCAPTCELKFKDPVQAVKATVAEIKANENADMIVCVSHSGTWDDPKKSEDELLAKGVPELDLILSGHTHSRIR